MISGEKQPIKTGEMENQGEKVIGERLNQTTESRVPQNWTPSPLSEVKWHDIIHTCIDP